MFEKCIAKQLYPFFEGCFSELLCSFKKGHSTQHGLLRLLNLWKRGLDDSNITGTLFTDLSKAYNCLPPVPELLISKLAPYVVKRSSLLFLYDYLTNRHHSVVKNGNSLSSFFIL